MLNIKHRDIRYQYKGRKIPEVNQGLLVPDFNSNFSYLAFPPFIRFMHHASRLTGDLEDGLGQTLDIAGSDTSDGDTTVLGGVDGVLLGQSIHLLGLQTSEGKHTNLAGDVGPVVLAAKLLKVLAEQLAHLDDAVSHTLDLTEPLLVQRSVVHDGGGDASTVDRGVRVEGTDENLDLRLDALLLLGVLADERESTDTLTIETLCEMLASSLDSSGYIHPSFDVKTYHVLGETLAQSDVVALSDEVARGKSILVSVAAGEALVSHVEESEVTLLLHDIANLAPLSLSRVNTSGVVSTGVKQDNAALGSRLDILDQTLKVQTDGVLVVVAVLLDLKARVLEDSVVVGPAGVGQVNLLRAGVEALEESTTNAEGTGTGDGLGDDETVVLNDGGAGAVGQLGGGVGEGRDTGDTSILLVAARSNNLVLGGANGGEDVGLALVVT